MLQLVVAVGAIDPVLFDRDAAVRAGDGLFDLAQQRLFFERAVVDFAERLFRPDAHCSPEGKEESAQYRDDDADDCGDCVDDLRRHTILRAPGSEQRAARWRAS
jgi:hypothetical protein